jgi:Cu+-exporting ATPase
MKILRDSILVSTAEGLRSGGKVALFVAVNNQVCGLFGLADSIRPESSRVISELLRLGIEPYMITGDEVVTARTIGAAVGIPQRNIYAKAKPEDKERIVSEIQTRGGVVCFVGDGTNDSPALARANVGVVMSSGTDIAIDGGDMVLCRNNLFSLLTALEVSRKALRRIKINYFWAIIYNIILIPFASGVLYPKYRFSLDPMYAGAAMAMSSVSVVVSSLLLLLFRNRYAADIAETAATALLDDIDSCKCPVSTTR